MTFVFAPDPTARPSLDPVARERLSTREALTGPDGSAESRVTPLELEADPRDRRGPFRPGRLASARRRLDGPTLKGLFQALDFALLVLLTLTIVVQASPQGAAARPFAWLLAFVLGPIVLLWSLRALQTYDFGQREQREVHLAKTAAASALAGVAAWASARMACPDATRPAMIWALAAGVTVSLGHTMAWSAVRGWRRDGRLTPNVVVVGATPNAARLIEAALQSGEMAVLGIFDDRADRVPASLKGVPVLGDTRSLMTHKILPYVDTVVITVAAHAQSRVRELIDRLSMLPNAVTLFVDAEADTVREATLSRVADAPLRQVSGARFDARRALLKRAVDLAFSTLGLMALAPVLAVTAIAVRLDSPGPILFRQRRHGFQNEAIVVWKFRSMRRETTDATATRQVSAGDDRVTRVGRFIRRTSLDELPQLWNVLRGEMSLVGPRPHAIGMLTAGKDAAQLVAEYAWRHRMKPGITGWAQINGSRGPVDTADAVRRRVALDVEYIERQSLWFDLYIILMTLPRLLGDSGSVR